MWIYLEKEELQVIEDALKHCGLHGMNFLLRSQLLEPSPVNPRHTKESAVKAAKTYFSASDTIIDDYVKWEPNGDALVMAWQKVSSAYIDEDCGCKKN
jgi:hypothetical protein